MKLHDIVRCCFVVLLFCTQQNHLLGQQTDQYGWKWLDHADTLNKKRFRGTIALGTAIYSATSYGLYQAWYKDYELTKFRTLNDAREWQQMDKVGHLITTYCEARWLYDGARWTGLNKKRSLWLAGTIAMGLQGTLEVMDGFSAEWGFSWYDIAYNTLGMATFVSQQAIWNDQRITIKVSSNRVSPPDYTLNSINSEATSTLLERNQDLFGTSIPERFLKDYNVVTIWASANINAFAPNSKWPKWLNIAVGYGSENLFGGYSNNWINDEGNEFQLSPIDFPRYRQYYLSLDIDLQRIPTKRRWLRSLLSIVNFIKIPAPALEYNSLGKFQFHPLYF
jgi:hypothetical protein